MYIQENTQCLLTGVGTIWDNRAWCAKVNSEHKVSILGKNAVPSIIGKETCLGSHWQRKESIPISVMPMKKNVLSFQLVLVKTWILCFLFSFHNVLPGDIEFSTTALASVLLQTVCRQLKANQSTKQSAEVYNLSYK